MKRLALIAVMFGCGCGSTSVLEGLSPEERKAKIADMRKLLGEKQDELKTAEADYTKHANERDKVTVRLNEASGKEMTEENEALVEQLTNQYYELEQKELDAAAKVSELQYEIEDLEARLDYAVEEDAAITEEEAYEAELAKAEGEEAAEEAGEEPAAEEAKAEEKDPEAAAAAEAGKASANDKQKVNDAISKGNAMTMEGIALFSKMTVKMGSLPGDKDELKAIQAQNQSAIDKLTAAKETFAGVRDKADDPSMINANMQRIDTLLGRLKGYDDEIKAKMN